MRTRSFAPLARRAADSGSGSPDASGAAATEQLERQRRPGPAARAPRWAASRTAARLVLSGASLVALVPPLATGWIPRADPLLDRVASQSALLAFAVLAVQVALAARLPLVDRALGIAAAMRLHRTLGLLALALLLTHATSLLLVSRGRIGWSWAVALGPIALAILVAGVLAALLFRPLRIDYDRWRAFHQSMIVVIVLGSVHGRAAGEDLAESPLLRAWWTAIVALVVAVSLWRRVFMPRWGRRRFRVESVVAEARGIWTLRLAPEDGRPFSYRPGQFVFLTLLGTGLAAEEHPFTLSSSPTERGSIAVTVKESGNYTRHIGRTRSGDRALVQGPFGKFTLGQCQAERLVFIAAGVGCTPLISMLRFLRDTADPRPVVFVCANRAEADIPFRDELDQLPASVTVIHVLSQPGATWRGRRGHLDGALLRELGEDSLARADVFLCGPPAFMDGVLSALGRLGIDRARVHLERFAIP